MENNMCEGGKCSGENCCKGGSCNGAMGHGCCMWKKCHMIKKIIWIVIVIIAFCLGTQLGELKSMARCGGCDNRGMMNWGSNYGTNWKSVQVDDGSTTPKVTPTTPAPKQ